MAGKRRGKWARWRCVQYEIGKPNPKCVCWLSQRESHTALIERLTPMGGYGPFGMHFWGVCPRIENANRKMAVQAIWLTPSSDGSIVRGHRYFFEGARQDCEALLAGHRKPVKPAPEAPIDEEEIYFV